MSDLISAAALAQLRKETTAQIKQTRQRALDSLATPAGLFQLQAMLQHRFPQKRYTTDGVRDMVNEFAATLRKILLERGCTDV